MNEREQLLALAETVRQACIQAALAGYEDASISGLCGEGALEVAISAMRRLDPNALVDAESASTSEPGDRPDVVRK